MKRSSRTDSFTLRFSVSRRRIAKAASIAAVLALSAFAAKRAQAYETLSLDGGPVLNPEIVPLFWGKWSDPAQTETDRALVRAYIDGFANYISGGQNPPGQETVLKQYGVWGATRMQGDFVDPGTNDTLVRNTGVYQRIHSLQSAGKLPANTPNRLFIVLLRGFKYDFTDDNGWDTTACAYHSLNNGTYYAVVPVDFPGYGFKTVNGKSTVVVDNHCQPMAASGAASPGSIETFHDNISHELGEGMTDPYLWNGWHTTEGIGGLTWLEAADHCEGSASEFTFSDGHGGTQNGRVTMFSDNLSKSCQSFVSMTTPRLGVSRGVSGVVDVFYPDGWPGELAHVTLRSDYTWSQEVLNSGSSAPMLYAPAVAIPASNRLDVFSRGGDGELWHGSKIGTGSWKMSKMPSGKTTIGQPAAIMTDQDRLDVAVQKLDSSVGNYAFADTATPSLVSLGGQTIGPPVLAMRSVGLVDVFTFGMHADVVQNTATNGTFGGYHVLVSGSNNMTPYPPAVVAWDANHEDVYMRGGGPSVVTHFNKTWSGKWANMASGTNTKMGLAVAPEPFQPGNYDVVWENTDSTYSAVHVTNNGATYGPVTSLGSDRYVSPPAVVYGNDGWPYIFGIESDGCLYVNNVDWWNGGGPSGAIFTGFCDPW